ncbi:hypothetical protein D3C84_1109880 [compost metagenome]
MPREHYAFKCPICSTIQSGADLVAAGAGENFDAVQRFLGFSCIGRFTGVGGYVKGTPPGKGCNWTLGGLFKMHDLEVVTEDGEHHPHFEPASPEEAQAHQQAKA